MSWDDAVANNRCADCPVAETTYDLESGTRFVAQGQQPRLGLNAPVLGKSAGALKPHPL